MAQAQVRPNKVVYDCMDWSPFYEDDQLYLDEKDLVEVSLSNPDDKAFSALNGSSQVKPQGNQTFSKINKVYKKMKPYYPL